MAKKSFTLKNTIHGIIQTFTVFENYVIIETNLKTEFDPSIGEMKISEARIYWKELLENGWVRI